MFRSIVNGVLSVFGQSLIANAELENYKNNKKRWDTFELQALKVNYIYNIVKPVLEKIEVQSLELISQYLENSRPLRSIFVDLDI